MMHSQVPRSAMQAICAFESFDAPWFIALEKRPESISLTDQGLTLTFATDGSGHLQYAPPGAGTTARRAYSTD